MTEPRPILVLGGSGLLGQAIQAALLQRGRAFVAPARSALDVTDHGAVARWLDRERPVAVINVAAYSDVALAERPDQRAEAFRLNRDAPAALAEICRRLDLVLVFLSTDFVFDGRLERPYREQDEPAPLQVYGLSKLEGERAVREAHSRLLIVRTSTLFGPGRRRRPHYVDAILDQARQGTAIEVVRKPVSSPTYTPDLAVALLDLLEREVCGTVHVVNAGQCSRLELACETVRLAGAGERVAVTERPESPDGPPRPAYSVLDTSYFAGLTGQPLRRWNEALADYVEEGSR